MRDGSRLSLVGLLGMVGLILAVAGCGSSTMAGSARHQEPRPAVSSGELKKTVSGPRGYIEDDGDNDRDGKIERLGTVDDDEGFLAEYGVRAGHAEWNTVTTLVKHYYAAALAEDGAKACALLDSTFASGLAEGDGPSGHSQSCATSVSHIFKERHRLLIRAKVATMTVIQVRSRGTSGLALLGFSMMPESVIPIQREGHLWKIDGLFASDLP